MTGRATMGKNVPLASPDPKPKLSQSESKLKPKPKPKHMPKLERERERSTSPPAHNVRQLSNEMVARVVDFLQDDVRSLKSCSLTSHCFLSFSRCLLFGVVHLNLRKCQKFLEVLESSPGVGPFVREVHVTVNPLETPPWVDKYLLPIAEKVPKVTALYLKGKAIYTAAPLLGFQAITSLHILNCEFKSTNEFLTLLGSFPRLETVYTNEMVVYRESSNTSRELHLPPDKYPKKFKSITFNSSRADADRVAEHIVELGFPKTLDYLAMCPLQNVGLTSLDIIARACGPRLKQLKLALVGMKEQGGFIGPLKKHVDLTLNTGLQCVELCSPAAYARMYGADDPSFSWFPHLLSQVSSPYIEEVGFYLWQDDLAELESPPWDEIVRLLSTSQFSSLKRVAFHVWGEQEPTSRVVTVVRRKFARFEDREMLHIDSTPDPACV